MPSNQIIPTRFLYQFQTTGVAKGGGGEHKGAMALCGSVS